MKPSHSREYMSKTVIFGLPLVHVAIGRDAVTGKKRVAKGIIAVGNIAIGLLAIGGVAVGGISIGGVSLGCISLGGLSIGALLALGGCALSGGLSCGGLAIGSIAAGGMAIGYFAVGGGAAGMHTLSDAGNDPEVAKLLSPSTITSSQWFALLTVFFPVSALILSIIAAIGFLTKSSALPEPATSLFGSVPERKAP